MTRDWDAERKALAAAFTELEMMKLWLQEHVQKAPMFTEEFRELNARLGKFGEIDEDGVHFNISVDRERWSQFIEACEKQAGTKLSSDAIETRAFYLWIDMIDKIIEHYNHDSGPVLLSIWTKRSSLEFEVAEYTEPPRARENDGPAMML